MKINRLIYSIITSLLIAFSFACKQEEHKTTLPEFNQVKVKQQFVKANQQVVIKENDEMDYFQKSHKMPFIKTASGVRYFVYSPSSKGDSIKSGDRINMHYKVTLLNGIECYSSKESGPKQLMVGMEDAEDGLHKGLLYLKSGDKALFLIPSHLAHGLLGDSKKIPPQSPIIYEVEIVSIIN